MFNRIYTKLNPLLGLSQQYRILIDGEDVTSHVTGRVTITEERGMLPELAFTLTEGDKWLRKLRYGSTHNITFSGGTLDPENTFSNIFEGTLFRSRGTFNKEGVQASITSFGKTWRGSTNPKSYIYPSTNSSRVWARKSTITLHEIITNVCKELNLVVGNFGELKNLTFTLEKPIRQDQTDWNFLLYIAERMKAIVWEENGKVYFSKFTKLKAMSSKAKGRLSFVYQDPLNPIQVRHNQILVSELTVEEDSEQQLGITRPFKNAKGEIVGYKDWKLDSAKVASENKANPEKMTSILNKIINDTITDEELNQFFIPYESKSGFKDDPFIEGDNSAFIGKTCDFTIPGRVDIRAYEYYPIYNISRFSSTDSSNWWFLQKLVHSWGPDGFMSELSFII